jgi:hypothetical protein
MRPVAINQGRKLARHWNRGRDKECLGMKKRVQSLVFAGLLGVGLLLGGGGCAAAEEFRAAAGDSLKSGVTTIATGLIDGIFAVFTPDNTTS